MTRSRIAVLLFMLAPSAPGFAASESPLGVWQRDNGASRVQFAPCGETLCGTVVWLRDRDSPSHLGQRVFFEMKAKGPNTWSGKALNPEDGRTYSGVMTLSGATLTTSGCVLAGLICRSAGWSRVR